jgi:hypothetical protein
MAWGTPTEDQGNAEYNFSFVHTNGTYLSMTIEAAVIENPADVEAAFASAAAVLDASSDFTYVGGSRTMPSTTTFTL